MIRALFRPARKDPHVEFLQRQLAVLDQALARKVRPLRPQDFTIPATSLKVIHGGAL